MKALVLFRSFHGNTQQVAEAMAQQIRASGHEVEIRDLRRKLPDLSGVDFIMIGAPTRMAKVSRIALHLLKRLRKRGFTEKPIAVFDTFGPLPAKPEDMEKSRKWLYPGAAGIMHKRAEAQGLNVYEKTLRCEVKGLKGPLADDEPGKAELFAAEFLSVIGKKP